MPQMARMESPGSLVHIMAHSIEGKPMFVNDPDRAEFLSRFEKGLAKTGYQCYTWALMDNHYHLLLRTSEKPMSKLMRGLNGGYARYYNKKHKKNGCLFQDRFKSVLCQDQNYAVQLIKYINLNPLRAGMVNSLEQLKNFQWCGHGFLIGKGNTRGETFQKREHCLRRFGDNELDAIKAYLQSLEESCRGGTKTAGHLSCVEATEIVGSCKGWPAVIGDPEFASDAFEKFKQELKRKHREADYTYVMETISKQVCEKYGITENELKKRGRMNTRTEARAVFCFLLHIKEAIPLSVISRFLGTTISPVAVLVQRGAAFVTLGP